MSTCDALRQQDDLLPATSRTGDLRGMAICASATSTADQVADLDETELHLLAVCPTARDRRIAAALVTACERRASSLGYSRVVLSTQPTMRAAHRVYEKLGYRRNPVRDWSTARNEKSYLVYEKRLSRSSALFV